VAPLIEEAGSVGDVGDSVDGNGQRNPSVDGDGVRPRKIIIGDNRPVSIGVGLANLAGFFINTVPGRGGLHLVLQ